MAKAKPSPSPAPEGTRSSPRLRAAANGAQIVAPLRPVQKTPTRASARLASKNKAAAQPSEVPQSEYTPMDTKVIKHRAFGGPIGAFFLLFFLPALLFYVSFSADKSNKYSLGTVPKFSRDWRTYISRDAFLAVVGWIVFQAFLAIIPVGKLVEGQPLSGSKRLKYRCNGFFAFVVTTLMFGVAVYTKCPVVKFVELNYFKLMVSSILFSFLLSVYLHIRARWAPTSELSSAVTGNTVYEFFMGRELNPRIGSFDLKFFCELRPGLIGWAMLNMCYLTSSYLSGGPCNHALWLVALCQMLYVADALWFEAAILTTVDITHEGFGFMLAFGDLAWVPFLYALQSRFLFQNTEALMPSYCLGAIAVLNLVGYMIFRGSNSQKNEFRNNPYNPALVHLESIPTPSGKRLLVSGWWGLCRHPNYLGDLIMALSWSLPCGFAHALLYFYPVYFLLLLIDRQRNDDALCQKKYGVAWTRYCDRVPYRIIPYIY